MTGTDDRSPGSIGQLALSWGLSPEKAHRIEAIAAALTVAAHVADERESRLHMPCEQHRCPVAREVPIRHDPAVDDAQPVTHQLE